MKSSMFSHAGWLVAGALGVVMLAGGFNQAAPKFGVVDMAKILSESTKGKTLKDELTNQFNIRQGLLEFVATNPTISTENATKLRELSVKAGATAAERTEIDTIKKAAQADEKTFETLGQKATLSDAERSQLEDLGTRRRNAQGLLQRWQQDFMQELNELEASRQNALIDEVRVVVQEVSKKEGYTVVFQTNVAIYGANDLTDESTKALNAKA